MHVSWRSEKVTQDKASGTTRPTFKATPLQDNVQILPDLREQVLLERLVHWFQEQVTCQDALIHIGTRKDDDTFRVEDIDKIGQGHTEKYSCSLNSHDRRVIPVSRSFDDFQDGWFQGAHFETRGGGKHIFEVILDNTGFGD